MYCIGGPPLEIVIAPTTNGERRNRHRTYVHRAPSARTTRGRPDGGLSRPPYAYPAFIGSTSAQRRTGVEGSAPPHRQPGAADRGDSERRPGADQGIAPIEAAGRGVARPDLGDERHCLRSVSMEDETRRGGRRRAVAGAGH